MKNLILAMAAASTIVLSACNNASNGKPADAQTNEADRIACIRTVLKLDEGHWNYMATIARLNGKFRTFETTSIHASTGPDTWSTQSSGGDVGAEYSDQTIT